MRTYRWIIFLIFFFFLHFEKKLYLTLYGIRHIFEWHLKKTRRKFSSFDFRFEFSTKNWIRITLFPDAPFIFKFQHTKAAVCGECKSMTTWKDLNIIQKISWWTIQTRSLCNIFSFNKPEITLNIFFGEFSIIRKLFYQKIYWFELFIR